MEIVLILFLAAAPVGGVDVLFYHVFRFRLFERPASAAENLSHVIRAAAFTLILALLLIGRPEGAWYWLVTGLFAIDFVNSLVDTALEPASRAPDVVPPLELVIHSAGATFMGFAWAAFMVSGWSGRMASTALAPHPEEFLVPDFVLWYGWFIVGSSTLLLALEAALRLWKGRRRMLEERAT